MNEVGVPMEVRMSFSAAVCVWEVAEMSLMCLSDSGNCGGMWELRKSVSAVVNLCLALECAGEC